MDGNMTITGECNIQTLDLMNDIDGCTIQEVINKLEEIKKENENEYDKIIIRVVEYSDWDECLWPVLEIEGQKIEVIDRMIFKRLKE